MNLPALTLGTNALAASECCPKTVSYTHLDVYKRQPLLYGGMLGLLYLGLLGMMVLQDTPSPMGLFLFSLHYLCYPVLAWLALSPRHGR